MANSDKNIRITTNKDTTSLPKIVFTGQNNSPITLYVLDDNTLSFEGSSGQLFSVNNVLSTGYIFGINDISGIPSFRINADGTVGIAEFTGNVGIGLTNPSFKFHLNGSAGFGASIWSSPSFSSSISGVILNNGAITNSGQISSTGRVSIQISDTAALAVKNAGGTSIFNVDTTNGISSVLSSTGSTSSATGALVITGGVGIGQTLFTSASYASSISGVILNNGTISGTLSGYASTSSNIRVTSAGNFNSSHTVLFTPSSSSSGSAVSSDATFFFNPSTEILNVSGLAITATTTSSSTATGSLQVAGGVGISGRLSFNQAALGTTGISINPTIAMIGTTGDPIYMSVLEDNTISFEGSQGQLFSITPNLSTGYIYSVNDITGIPLLRANANANVTANEFAGNFGIGLSNPAYKLHVIGSVGFTSNINSTSTSTGTLVVGGGVGIAGTANIGSNAFIGGNLSVTGNFTVNGTTTTIESTVSTLADPIFVLGAAAGGTQPYVDDNKDRGIEFRYVSGTGKTGFFGFQDSTGKFTFIPDGTNSGEVFSGAAGTAAFGTVEATRFIGAVTGTATTATNVLIVGAGNSNLAHSILFTPNSSSSGSAISSDTTISFNPFTETLSVSGLAVTAGTASTSPATGAMVVSGSVGIGGTVNIGGDESVLGRLYYSQSTVGVAGTSTIPSISFIGQDNNPITLSVLTDNTLSFEGSSGQLFSINNNLSSGTIFSINDISGIPILRANANGTLSMGEFSGNVGVGLSLPSYKFQVNGSAGFGGTVVISSTTASTSTSSGALTIAGGAGIGGSVNIGGKVGIGTNLLNGQLNILNFTASTPSIVIQGATSQSEDFIRILSSTGSTSISIDKDGKIIFPSQSGIQLFAENYSSTGRIRTSGPMIVYGQISSYSDGVNESYLNSGTLYIQGLAWTPYGSPSRWSTNNAVRIQPTSTSVVPLVVQLQNASWTSGNAFEIQNNGVLKFNVDYAGSTTILSTVGSASTTTGALVVYGGVGIGGSLNTSASYASSVSGVILNNGTITGTLSGYATTSNNIRIVGTGNSNLSHPVLFTPSSSSSGSAVSSDNTFFFNSFTEILSVSGLAVTASTASTSATTGALIVTGGVGVGATITVGLGVSTPVLSSASNLIIKPGVDSTTAIQFTRSSTALPVITIDTLNSRVGIGNTTPEFDLDINGEISATTKSFLIPHPTKENMKLRHGSLEGPENGVYIRGELKDSNEILFPDYWEKLIDHSTITVHLTPIGNKTIFVKEIKDNKVIVGAKLFQKIHCFYTVWAERKDVPKLKVEF